MTAHSREPLSEVIDRPIVYLGAGGRGALVSGRAVRRTVIDGVEMIGVRLGGVAHIVWVPAEREVRP